METLEFVIYPDGRVQEAVIGLAGSSCTEVTSEIEAQLGHLITQDLTSDFFTISSAETTQVISQGATEKLWWKPNLGRKSDTFLLSLLSTDCAAVIGLL